MFIRPVFNLADIDAAAAFVLKRRQLFSSEYHIDVMAIMTQFSLLCQRSVVGQMPGALDLVIIASRESSFATIVTPHGRTLVMDIGFIEQMIDYRLVFFQAVERFSFLWEAEVDWCAPFVEQTPAQMTELRLEGKRRLGFDQFVQVPILPSEYLDRLQQMEGRPADLEALAAAQVEKYGKEALERFDPEREFYVTGSMIFRDLAAKMMRGALGAHIDRDMFNAFCLATVKIGDQHYRPATFLHNFIATYPKEHGEYPWHYRAGVTMATHILLLHELAHALSNDADQAAWRNEDVFPGVRELAEAMKTHVIEPSHFLYGVWDDIARNDPADWRLQRAISEAFFDHSAARTLLTGYEIAPDPGAFDRALGNIMLEFVPIIAVMVLRDAMAKALEGHGFMQEDSTAAFRETAQRCLVLAAALYIDHFNRYPDSPPSEVLTHTARLLEGVQVLSGHFLNDLTINLPRSPFEDEDIGDYQASAWADLMRLISPAASCGPGQPTSS